MEPVDNRPMYGVIFRKQSAIKTTFIHFVNGWIVHESSKSYGIEKRILNYGAFYRIRLTPLHSNCLEPTP